MRRHQHQPNNNGSNSQRTEPAPAPLKWKPKEEQISILENIFNSGIVNPQIEENKEIRKRLEKYGAVGEVSVFHWFQNRRSKRVRQQRWIEAQLSINNNNNNPPAEPINPEEENNLFHGFTPPAPMTTASAATLVGLSSSSSGNDYEGGTNKNLAYLGSFYQQQQIQENSYFCTREINQYGIITVFINGVAMEVLQRWPLDVRGMFGEDMMLLHCSGLPVPVNDHGILLEPLQHGETYFLNRSPNKRLINHQYSYCY